MKISSTTGLASKNDIQIQVSARWLFIDISGASTTVTEALLKTAYLSWSKAGKRAKAIQPAISLYDLAEQNAQKQGFFYMDGSTGFKCMVEIGDGGAIECNDSDYISLNFSGFPVAWTSNIYTVDDAQKSNRVLKYIQDSINSKPAQDLDLQNCKALYMPVGAVQVLFLSYNTIDTNGQPKPKTVRYEPEELRGLMMLDAEILTANSLTNANGLVMVSDEYFAIDTRNAVKGYLEYVPGSTSKVTYLRTEDFNAN